MSSIRIVVASLSVGLLLASAPLAAGLEGIELLGFGEAGESLTYSEARRVTLRYRLTGEADGEPVNVILRRDDGATVVVSNVRQRGEVLAAEVPLKDQDWTLNEFEAFALEPTRGTIHEGPATRTIIRVGRNASTRGLARTLERTRERLAARGRAEAPAGLYEPPPRVVEPGFEGEILAGFDLDLHADALD